MYTCRAFHKYVVINDVKFIVVMSKRQRTPNAPGIHEILNNTQRTVVSVATG